MSNVKEPWSEILKHLVIVDVKPTLVIPRKIQYVGMW